MNEKEFISGLLLKLQKEVDEERINKEDIINYFSEEPDQDMQKIINTLHIFFCKKQGLCTWSLENTLEDTWSKEEHKEWWNLVGETIKNVTDIDTFLLAINDFIQIATILEKGNYVVKILVRTYMDGEGIERVRSELGLTIPKKEKSSVDNNNSKHTWSNFKRKEK